MGINIKADVSRLLDQIVKQISPREARFVVRGFYSCCFVLLLAGAYWLMKPAPPAAPSTPAQTVNNYFGAGVVPGPAIPATPSIPAEPSSPGVAAILGQLHASMDIQSRSPPQRQDDGSYVVSAVIHTTSKFQRSGVVLHWDQPVVLAKFEPLNQQPTVAGPLNDQRSGYSLYIQRPWGLYFISFRVRDTTSLKFTYRFEGEDHESDAVDW
jgi:hypothetical protein